MYWEKETIDLSFLDEDFLSEIVSQSNREIFARIIALDINELPLEYIEGKVTNGNVNIDGKSNVRRTCSVTLVTNNININDYYWGLKTKFKLFIGLKNNLTDRFKYVIGGKYPEIVWFKLGVFLITTFNTSLATNNQTISISGKDKMCLLNGETGGQIYASVDFGTEDFEEKIITPVIIEVSNSKEIETYKYYIDDFETENLEEKIYIRDSNFAFSKDENGTYYKNGNFYSKNFKETDGQKYKIYKLAICPDDFFKASGAESAIFIKNGDLYQVDKREEKTGIHYELKQLYTFDYIITNKKIPIKKIIKEAVHAYAKEPYQKILINDLDDYGLEQLTYKGDTPLYALRSVATGLFTQLFFLDSNQTLKNLIEKDNFIEDSLTEGITGTGATKIYKYKRNNEPADWALLTNTLAAIIPEEDQYTVVKFNYGDDVGYRVTDLVYAGDLISNVGESLTQVLDKIKNMLGDFEYFYDVDGNFVFQKKRAYVDTYWSQLMTNTQESYINYANAAEQTFAFNFEDSRLITSFNNSPNLNNLKNDYSVWGKRKGVSGAEIPIHVRYAIDRKPKEYCSLAGVLYYTVEVNNIRNSYPYLQKKQVDWRELIYQMALDYFAAGDCSEENSIFDLNGRTVLSNPDLFLVEVGLRNQEYYPTGYTGYEQYYTDMEGFWRQLYNPDYIPTEIYTKGQYIDTTQINEETGYYEIKTVWQEPEFSDLEIDFYVSIEDHDGKILSQYNEISKDPKKKSKYLKYFLTPEMSEVIQKRKYWAINVFENPENLNFWIDFLDDDNELAHFSVPVVGDRSKTVNDDKMKAIYYKEVPGFVLKNSSTTDFDESVLKENEVTGYNQINIPEDFIDYFTLSFRGLSAKNKIDELLYQNAYCVETATISTIPIYSLLPNTRIYIKDDNTKINGEYIIDKITIQLTYNGTMSITAVKAPIRLY